MKMKKKMLLVLTTCMALCLCAMTGCGNDAADHDENMVTGTVSLSGSTSMEKVGKALCEGFNNEYPNVVVDLQLGGSSVGVQNVIDGKSDIGNCSRALKDSETSAGITGHTIAIDGIAVIVNNANPVKDLTKEQLVGIYTGKITNWSMVGGKDMPIVVIGREASSGTRGAFEEILKVEEQCKYGQEKNETGAVKTSVATTENAIGYVSLDVIDDTVSLLSLGGVSATEENIVAGNYFLSRPFVMATKTGAETETTQLFLEFVMSEKGQEIVKAVGLISVAE